ncbi:class I SAM-dependent methyltransferase [Dactylosporangium sp. NPDC049140]|uniref:O-methyltransferase n=1 Tax=Dactylosporangium sp. NPDC049140 TaxID=3155647 RepID=UPI0033C105F5
MVTPLIAAAQALGFAQSCRDEHGELLRVLARGVGAGAIGETGTGCGVGLAWLAAGAAPGARLVSIERDPARAAAAAELFATDPRVEVRLGDWRELHAHGPFDLLVLDGGGQGKGADPPLDPAAWLRPGGLIVMDDFTPCTTWPPTYEGRVDEARRYWLTHPDLLATQVNVAPDAATLLATYLPGLRAPR